MSTLHEQPGRSTRPGPAEARSRANHLLAGLYAVVVAAAMLAPTGGADPAYHGLVGHSLRTVIAVLISAAAVAAGAELIITVSLPMGYIPSVQSQLLRDVRHGKARRRLVPWLHARDVSLKVLVAALCARFFFLLFGPG